uniref:Radical SAM superfamily enzyme YgiQ, UPF0313 family n=1 Tax=Candidatus Kentrum sp. FW TaxID=2126338 RepID=A0A450TK32_9GAMM|nr:MAG: Radical SAM superfamily enzyme YgiQ, UPF0313 family [Candidatus Kentron sp. FW]
MADSMRILFINDLLGKDAMGRTPLGVLYLSSALKRAGHAVDLVDTKRFSDITRKIEDFRPDMLLFSVRTTHQGMYAQLNRKIKGVHPDLFSIFGGPHPTFYPQLIHNDEAVDAVCIGEGEEAIVDFMERLEDKGDYHLTPNFWVRRKGHIHKNPVRKLIEDIDTISFPDRDLLDAYPVVRGLPIRNFITSRGCPYNCTYCFNHAYNEIYQGLGKRIRRRSVDNVIAEIEQEQNNNPFQLVQFEDDIFVMQGKWLREFAPKYKKRIGLPFMCNARAELVTEKAVSLIKEAGCVSVCVGVESGDEAVRKELLKRNNTDSVTIECVRLLQHTGIFVLTENILGLPETSIDDDFKTLELNRILKPGFANPSIYQPYPGTDLGWESGQERRGHFPETIRISRISSMQAV